MGGGGGKNEIKEVWYQFSFDVSARNANANNIQINLHRFLLCLNKVGMCYQTYSYTVNLNLSSCHTCIV